MPTINEKIIINQHIEEKQKEIKKIKLFWELFNEFDEKYKFNSDGKTALQTITSNLLAKLEISIEDHKKLLVKPALIGKKYPLIEEKTCNSCKNDGQQNDFPTPCLGCGEITNYSNYKPK